MVQVLSIALVAIFGIFVIVTIWAYSNAIKRILRDFVHDIWASADLSDAKQKLWETRLKIIAALGVIIGGWWAVHSYNTTAERELRKAFWEKQIVLYFEASEATTAIATLPPDSPARKIAIDRFWQLYFGPLRVVEDDENVGNAMISFGVCLTRPGDSGPEKDCTQDELQQKSLRLAVHCRLSIAANWNRKLDGLNKL